MPGSRRFALWLSLAACASAQVVYIDQNSTGGGSGLLIPFSKPFGHTSIQVYTAAQLGAGGVTAGATLVDMAVGVFGQPSFVTGVYTAPQFLFRIGHLGGPLAPGAWGSQLQQPVTVHDLSHGPYRIPWTGTSWASLPCVGEAGFVWNGQSDIAVLISSGPNATGTFAVAITAPGNPRLGIDLFNASNQQPTVNSTYSMRVRLTFAPAALPVLFQRNQAIAFLDIDGVTSTSCAAGTFRTCAGTPSTLHFGSSNPGSGFELALTSPQPLVSSVAGGLTLPFSRQVCNLDLTATSLTFLFGLALPPIPPQAAVPLVAGAPVSAAAQLLVIDPLSADGISLSGGINYIADPVGSSVPGPTQHDSFTTLQLGVPPFCGPASIPWYGTSVSRLYVSSNGRVTVGAGSGSSSVSPVGATLVTGMVGNWCALDPSMGGSVTCTSTASTVSVSYLNVPYGLLPFTSNSFTISFDAGNGSISLTGLGGIQPHPGPFQISSCFLGISPGPGATIAAPSVFAPSATGGAANATDMIYAAGPAGTLAPGVSSILFTLNGAGNYQWSCQ